MEGHWIIVFGVYGNDLHLQIDLCCFAAESVKYLGPIITKEGVKTDRSKVEAVQGFPVPTNEQEVRSFIGLCTYYRRFVKGFANIAGPLLSLYGHRNVRKLLRH